MLGLLLLFMRIYRWLVQILIHGFYSVILFSIKAFTCIIWFNQHLRIKILKDIHFQCNLFTDRAHCDAVDVTKKTKRLRVWTISLREFKRSFFIWMFYASFRPHTNLQFVHFERGGGRVFWIALKLYAIKHW